MTLSVTNEATGVSDNAGCYRAMENLDCPKKFAVYDESVAADDTGKPGTAGSGP